MALCPELILIEIEFEWSMNKGLCEENEAAGNFLEGDYFLLEKSFMGSRKSARIE